MNKNESVNEFCERFDAIIREYETCGEGVELTKQEMRSAFYQAVTPGIPQLRDADLIKRTNSKEMTLEEIKSSREEEQQDDQNIKANRVNSGSRGREDRCHRCSGPGHWEQQCPWKEKGMWDCYECKKMTDHKASDHEKYPDRFRKRGGNTFRGKDFKKHDKTEYNKNQYRGRGLEKNEQKGVKSNKNNKSTKNTKSNYNNYKSANNNRDQKGKESLRREKVENVKKLKDSAIGREKESITSSFREEDLKKFRVKEARHRE
ncbi:Protein of unknown function [Cotesia congregata]|uniref:CCHC-type domain-containing protein n=1 Tax=Cotesia congregata TaxID=51543 RepID=A0A8J2HL79_COTCN|nr:Protein of unknown function [Cotesia congregata]